MIAILAKHKFLCLIIILFIVVTIISILLFIPPISTLVNSNWTEINCDVKIIRLNTEIIAYKNNAKLGTIRGNIIRLLTDPLTYYDVNETKLAYASDNYHLIAQDSHAIVVDDKVTVEMVGKVKLFGNSYDIYDTTGNKIAEANFSVLHLNGSIKDISGSNIAIYKANPILKDYTIYISPNCKIDETTIMMIVASF